MRFRPALGAAFAVVAALAVALGYGLGLRRAQPPAVTEARPDPPAVAQEPAGDPREPLAVLGSPGFRHDAPLEAAALSRDGEILVSLDSAGFLYGWKRPTGERLYRLKAPGPPVERPALACSPDGRAAAFFARGGSPSVVTLFELKTGREIRRLDRCGSPVFSPDGRVLGGSDGGSIRRWQVEGGLELPRIEEAELVLLWVAYSPDGRTLASTFKGRGGFSLRDALTGREIHRSAPESDYLPATGLAFTPDGKGLAVGNIWGVRIWNRDRPGDLLLSCAAYSGPPLAFSPDGRWLIGAHFRRLLGIWDTKTAEQAAEVFVRSDPGNFMGVSERGDVLIRATGARIDLQSVADVAGGRGSPAVATASVVSFLPDGRAVAGGLDGKARFYDASSGREIETRSAPSGEMVALSGDSSRAVLKHGEGSVQVWDLGRGEGSKRLEGLRGIVAQALSPDGDTLAVGTRAGVVALVDVGRGVERARTGAAEAREGITALSFSPDQRLIAWGEGSGAVVLADADRGREALRFRPRGSPISSLAFSPDGSGVATGGERGEVLLWGREAGVEPAVVARLEARVTALAFSPDGRRLACGTSEGELVLARTRGDGPSFSYAKRQRPYTSVAFSRDGRRLVTGSAGSPSLVWSLPPEE